MHLLELIINLVKAVLKRNYQKDVCQKSEPHLFRVILICSRFIQRKNKNAWQINQSNNVQTEKMLKFQELSIKIQVYVHFTRFIHVVKWMKYSRYNIKHQYINNRLPIRKYLFHGFEEKSQTVVPRYKERSPGQQFPRTSPHTSYRRTVLLEAME